MEINNLEWVHWPDPRAVTRGPLDTSIRNLTLYSEAYQQRQQ